MCRSNPKPNITRPGRENRPAQGYPPKVSAAYGRGTFEGTRTLIDLNRWGFDARFRALLELESGPGSEPARVVEEQRGGYTVITHLGRLAARTRGGLMDRPVIGDWVAIDPISETDTAPDGQPAMINAILERRSGLVRTTADAKRRDPARRRMVMAANVDLVFIATALDQDYSLRRVERLLTLAWDGGASPVVVLTKADLDPEPEAKVTEAEAVAPGADVLAVSIRSGLGLDRLAALFTPGRTAVIVGSSGVGKSSLINRLAGSDVMAVGRIREGDGKGRHTTTHRRMIPLPSGGLIIDTPGLRAVGLTDAGEGLRRAFADIQSIAQGCRFRDCGHDGEPGCAVRLAVKKGDLDADRLAAWQSLDREIAARSTATDPVQRRKAGREMNRMIKEAKQAKKIRH